MNPVRGLIAPEAINSRSDRFIEERFIFSSLHYQPDFIFTKALLDKGKHKFEFYDLSTLEQFKTYFKQNIQKVIGLLLGLEVEQVINFKIE